MPEAAVVNILKNLSILKVCLFLQDLTGISEHCVLSGNDKRMC